MIDSKLRKYFQAFFDFLARPLVRAGVSPTQVTVAAAILGLAGAGFTTQGRPVFRLIAFFLGLLSALLDILDGTVARQTGRSSPLGAFLDLIFDRVVEAAFILAFAYAFPSTLWPGMVFLALVIVNFSAFLAAGSLFPNTGSKSMHYETGLVERTETFILFGLMLAAPVAAHWLLWVFNSLMAYTAVRRFQRVISYARKNGMDGRQASRDG